MNGSLVPWVHALHRHGAMLHTLNPTCAPHWTLEQRARLSALWQDWDHALVRLDGEDCEKQVRAVLGSWDVESPVWSWVNGHGQMEWAHPAALALARLATPAYQIPSTQRVRTRAMGPLLDHLEQYHTNTLAGRWFPDGGVPSQEVTWGMLAVLAIAQGDDLQWLAGKASKASSSGLSRTQNAYVKPVSPWKADTATLAAVLAKLAQDTDRPAEVLRLVRAASELMPFTAGIDTYAWNDWAVAWENLQKKTGLDFQKQHEEVAGFHDKLKRTYLSSHLESAWSAPLTPSSSSPRL